MSKVYFIDFKTSPSHNIFKKIEDVLKKSGITESIFQPDEIVALKLHFGEPGNTNFIKPIFLKEIAKIVKSKKAIPFLTDANSLYVGKRALAPTHLEVAAYHGFTDVPVIIADGLRGEQSVSVKINGKHLKELKIASAIYYADAILAISHFKGHFATGFGGALKNLGMGCAAKRGKLDQHSGAPPTITENCKSCGLCIKWCPADAIVKTGKRSPLAIKQDKCICCGVCIGICPNNAVEIEWGDKTVDLQEKMVEYAKGVVQNKKVGYINFLTDISTICDCWPATEPMLVPDIGILVSTDPVSIDKASFDLVNSASNGKFATIWPNTKPEVQLDYAEELALGSKKYELIKL